MTGVNFIGMENIKMEVIKMNKIFMLIKHTNLKNWAEVLLNKPSHAASGGATGL